MPRGLKVIDVVIATAGVRVQLSSVSGIPKYVRSVSIVPMSDNAGDMYIGDSEVTATHNSRVLSTIGDSWEWVSDFIADPRDSRANALELDSVYIDSEENGDGVCVSFEEALK